jgi:hypothetical protein
MRSARLRTSFVALAASASLGLAGTGVAQAAPATQEARTAAPAAAPAASPVSAPVTGSFTDALGGVGNFTGTFTPTRFVNQNGQITAVGTLTGTLTDSAGTSLGSVTQQVNTPVQANATCDILNLDLGPLDLNLLGLQVHLDEIVLDITAQQGPGNLLGNLLCAVAGLLDNTGGGGGILNGVVALLNRILGAL